MRSEGPKPGVSRSARLSAEGLARLEKQLESGIRISPVVLQQWIRRYGDDARKIIDRHLGNTPDLD